MWLKNKGEFMAVSIVYACVRRFRGFLAAMLFLVFFALFSGCEEVQIKPIEQSPDWFGTPVADAGEKANIKEKFGVTLEGKSGINATFNELHTYIQNGGLNDGASNVIKLGDWIDLDGGMTVEAYNDAGEFSAGQDPHWNRETKFNGEVRKMDRLIVVGVNSFPENTPHVVFQFENAPVLRRMNEKGTNTGGYEASEMRKYLAKIDGDAASGKFLKALIGAGVPEAVLWGPSRIISTGGKAVTDLLWLPTEPEMFGAEAGLDYYKDNDRRKKISKSMSSYDGGVITGDGSWYWVASASETHFRAISGKGVASYNSADQSGGVVPAFCIW
jgi:hypothetical protein